MRIHISESCNEYLRETDFETEYRGLVELKVCIIFRTSISVVWIVESSTSMSSRVVNNRPADRLKHRIFRLEDYTHKITTPCLMLISIFTYVNVNSHIIGGSRLTPHARHMHVTCTCMTGNGITGNDHVSARFLTLPSHDQHERWPVSQHIIFDCYSERGLNIGCVYLLAQSLK